MIAVFLAQGFEEIEALAVVDVLRRAELPVKTVGVGGKEITGAHGICVKADMEEKEVSTASRRDARNPESGKIADCENLHPLLL